MEVDVSEERSLTPKALLVVEVMISVWVAGIAGQPLESFPIRVPILRINEVPETHQVAVRLD